jgi:homoserine kinase
LSDEDEPLQKQLWQLSGAGPTVLDEAATTDKENAAKRAVEEATTKRATKEKATEETAVKKAAEERATEEAAVRAAAAEAA